MRSLHRSAMYTALKALFGPFSSAVAPLLYRCVHCTSLGAHNHRAPQCKQRINSLPLSSRWQIMWDFMKQQGLQDDPVTGTKSYIHMYMHSNTPTRICGTPAHIPIFSTRYNYFYYHLYPVLKRCSAWNWHQKQIYIHHHLPFSNRLVFNEY